LPRPTSFSTHLWRAGRPAWPWLSVRLENEALNIPARYATGYLGDIGVVPSPSPMDFENFTQFSVRTDEVPDHPLR
jgi:hypothetical protein